jgi:hypothetical protein
MCYNSPEEIIMAKTAGSKNLPKHLQEWNVKYLSQKHSAIKRGIEFNLTFAEWYNWWLESGQIHNRGTLKGQYVMARMGDSGAYQLDNIKCITAEENHLECLVGKKHSHETKLKQSRSAIQSWTGRRRSSRDRLPEKASE